MKTDTTSIVEDILATLVFRVFEVMKTLARLILPSEYQELNKSRAGSHLFLLTFDLILL